MCIGIEKRKKKRSRKLINQLITAKKNLRTPGNSGKRLSVNESPNVKESLEGKPDASVPSIRKGKDRGGADTSSEKEARIPCAVRKKEIQLGGH